MNNLLLAGEELLSVSPSAWSCRLLDVWLAKNRNQHSQNVTLIPPMHGT